MQTSIGARIERELVTICVVSGALFLASLALRYAVAPGVQRLAAARRTVADMTRRVEKESGNQGLQAEIEAKQQRLNDKLASLRSGLADPSDISSLLQVVFNKAWEAGVRIEKAEPQEQSQQKLHVAYPLLIEITGTYNSVGKFVSLVESSPQFLRIERLALTSKPGGVLQARALVACFLAPKEDSK